MHRLIWPSASNITKTRLFKYTENLTTKNWKFSDKNSDIFHVSARRGGSNEYRHVFVMSLFPWPRLIIVNGWHFVCMCYLWKLDSINKCSHILILVIRKRTSEAQYMSIEPRLRSLPRDPYCLLRLTGKYWIYTCRRNEKASIRVRMRAWSGFDVLICPVNTFSSETFSDLEVSIWRYLQMPRMTGRIRNL